MTRQTGAGLVDVHVAIGLGAPNSAASSCFSQPVPPTSRVEGSQVFKGLASQGATQNSKASDTRKKTTKLSPMLDFHYA